MALKKSLNKQEKRKCLNEHNITATHCKENQTKRNQIIKDLKQLTKLRSSKYTSPPSPTYSMTNSPSLISSSATIPEPHFSVYRNKYIARYLLRCFVFPNYYYYYYFDRRFKLFERYFNFKFHAILL